MENFLISIDTEINSEKVKESLKEVEDAVNSTADEITKTLSDILVALPRVIASFGVHPALGVVTLLAELGVVLADSNIELRKYSEEAATIIAQFGEVSQLVSDSITGMISSQNAYLDKKTSIDDYVISAENLAKELEHLSKIENKSADDKAAVAGAVHKLNALFPDLNLEYNAETDALNMSTDALEDYIDMRETQLALDAAVQRDKSISTEILTAEDDLLALAEKIWATEDAMAALKDSANDKSTWDQIVESVGSVLGLTTSDMLEWGELEGIIAGYHTEYDELFLETQGLHAEQTAVNEEINKYSGELLEVSSSANTYMATINQLAESYANLSNAEFFSQLESGELNAAAANMEIGARMQEEILGRLTESYNNFKEMATNMLSGAPEAIKMSLEAISDNLNSNDIAMQEWSSSLGGLIEQGVGADVIDQLRALGPEYRGVVAEMLASMTDGVTDKKDEYTNNIVEMLGSAGERAGEANEEVYANAATSLSNAIMEEWSEEAGLTDAASQLMQKAMEGASAAVDAATVSDTLDGLVVALQQIPAEDANGVTNAWTTMMKDSITTAGSNAAIDAQTSGEALGAGFALGMDNMLVDVETSAGALGTGAIDSINTTTETHSPSEATKRTGEAIGEGLRLGILNSAADVSNTAENLGRIALSALEGVVSEFNDVGRQMMEGVESGIRRGESGVINAATRVAKAATQAVRDILKIKSPSKVMEEIGKQTWEGFIKGMDEELEAVISQSESIASEAIKAVQEKIDKLQKELADKAAAKEKEREKERLKELKKAVSDAKQKQAKRKACLAA